MKIKALAAAISVVTLSGFAQVSQATDMYLAGSSAQDNLVLNEVYKLCANNGADFKLYLDNNGTVGAASGANYKAYSCTVSAAAVAALNAASGITADEVVTFHKVNLGGSAAGVTPLVFNQTELTLNPNNGNCTSVANTNLPNLTPTVSVATYSCRTSASGDLTAQYLDAGLADVNPLLFQGVNKAWISWNGSASVVAPEVFSIPSTVSVVAGSALTFAVPVTKDLYVALQAAQGLLKYTSTTTVNVQD
jgi:hypothetical protein